MLSNLVRAATLKGVVAILGQLWTSRVALAKCRFVEMRVGNLNGCLLGGQRSSYVGGHP